MDTNVMSSTCVIRPARSLWTMLVAVILCAVAGQGIAPAGEKKDEPTSKSRTSARPTRGLESLGYSRTQLYGIEAQGAKFVYVFDRSASMDGAPLAAAKKELLASLDDLGDLNQFHVVFYNHSPRVFSPGVPGRLAFATEQNKHAAGEFIASMEADGATDHYSALLAALHTGADVIYLLTDGDESDDLTSDELKQLARRNSGQSVIHVVQFGGEQSDNNLVQLAAENGGQHKYVAPPK